MKPQPRAEAERWLAQARSDLAFAEVGVREGYHAQACFLCQQAAEKALKALRYLGGERHYVPTRYPNGLPAGTPADVFSKAQGQEAVTLARQVVERAAGLAG